MDRKQLLYIPAALALGGGLWFVLGMHPVWWLAWFVPGLLFALALTADKWMSRGVVALAALLGASVVVAIPAAFLLSGCVGMLIERGVVKFLYGRPLETLLATFGVSLILQPAVRDIAGTANNMPVSTPEWLAGVGVTDAGVSPREG